uniref:Homeobox domain-containing protein n=1 Tax=Hymenolepis diminuta TaxID=6216 RepID=A0A0R3SMF0_HYMDI
LSSGTCRPNEFCFIMEGRLICRHDYIRLYAVKFAACKMLMLMHELCMRTSPNEVYHFNCFQCSMCDEQLSVGAEYARDPSTNAPICRKYCVPRSSSTSHLPHQSYNSGKRGRTTLSAKQHARFEQVFETNPRPNTKLGLPMRVVQVWFQNQRAREKVL